GSPSALPITTGWPSRTTSRCRGRSSTTIDTGYATGRGPASVGGLSCRGHTGVSPRSAGAGCPIWRCSPKAGQSILSHRHWRASRDERAGLGSARRNRCREIRTRASRVALRPVNTATGSGTGSPAARAPSPPGVAACDGFSSPAGSPPADSSPADSSLTAPGGCSPACCSPAGCSPAGCSLPPDARLPAGGLPAGRLRALRPGWLLAGRLLAGRLLAGRLLARPLLACPLLTRILLARRLVAGPRLAGGRRLPTASLRRPFARGVVGGGRAVPLRGGGAAPHRGPAYGPGTLRWRLGFGQRREHRRAGTGSQEQHPAGAAIRPAEPGRH